jgi:hypothetical protein
MAKRSVNITDLFNSMVSVFRDTSSQSLADLADHLDLLVAKSLDDATVPAMPDNCLGRVIVAVAVRLMARIPLAQWLPAAVAAPLG